ncbi:MAG: exodeoxyribonuclease V subunit beta [Pirellulaceae bacterium]|nr:exodeoxyribonuclease V subunit beta [Pirellulaceae bacterium]
MPPLDFRTFPLHGSRLIEASAGTGKTYTIALLYVRYVLGHGEDASFNRSLQPNEILVVTFTDAASQELRDRIRQRLNEAARWFRDPGQVNPADPLARILADYRDPSRELAADKLERAAETMDEAAVSTIHSWCYRMLREHAFESHLLFSQKLNANPGEIFSECVEDYWRRHFYPYHDRPELAAAVMTCWKAPFELQAQVKYLLGKPNRQTVHIGQPITKPDNLDELLARAIAVQEQQSQWQTDADAAETHARGLVAANWSRIAALLRDAPLNGGTYHRSGSREQLLDMLKHWADGSHAETDDLKKIQRLGTGRFKLNKGGVEPRHEAFDAIGLWCDLLEQQPEVLEPPLSVSLLLHAADWVSRELQQRLLARGELSYDDMLVRLHAALQGTNGERLAQAIRQKFPVAMIDEFQDTDPIQYEIFDRIYRVRDNDSQLSLVMIGDPKQAIYAFRGADIYTYLQAKQACDSRCETLGTNHRSTLGMVQAVNHLFQHAEHHAAGAFRFRTESSDPIPFAPVAAQGRNEVFLIEGQPVTPLQFWYLPGENEHGVTGPADYRQQLADASASEIVRWLTLAAEGRAGFRSEQDFRALRPRDIAILVRTGREAAQIRQALQRRGVSSVYLSDKDSVFETHEARDILRWLLAVANPADERLIKTALTTASLRMSLDELRTVFDDEDRWDETINRFRNYHQLWQNQGVLPMLRALLWDFDAPKKLLAESHGERALTNLLHVSEWLQQTSSSVDGELALIRRLGQQMENPTDEQILRLESDADLIKVITIHKSKGLEYPLVLLPFICSYRESNRSKVVDYHQRTGDSTGYDLRTELAGGSKLAPESYRQANQERLSEDMRLLYVALTRAQHALWLGCSPVGKTLKSRWHSLAECGIGYLLFGESRFGADQVEQNLRAAVSPCPAIEVSAVPKNCLDRLPAFENRALGPARRVTRRLSARWWIASYSALRLREQAAPERAREEIAAEEVWDVESQSLSVHLVQPETTNPSMLQFPRGPQAGTFLHSILEWATDRGFNRVAEDRSLRQSFLQRITRQANWGSWCEPLNDWLDQFLHTELPLGSCGLRLSELKTEQTQAELEFWFETNSVPTRILDRMVTTGTVLGRPRPALEADQLNGLLKGFVDLVFEYQGRYYIADWKSNDLGSRSEDYHLDALQRAICDKRYDMQYSLYLVALHRHLRQRLANYDYDQHIGGAAYVFLRGLDNPSTRGVYFERPPWELIDALDQLFCGAGPTRAATYPLTAGANGAG